MWLFSLLLQLCTCFWPHLHSCICFLKHVTHVTRRQCNMAGYQACLERLAGSSERQEGQERQGRAKQEKPERKTMREMVGCYDSLGLTGLNSSWCP